MKRIVVLITVAACLLFGIETVFAQSKGTDRGEAVEPNAKPGRVESRDSNESAGKSPEQEREKLREGARERIREVAEQRRQGRIGEGQQPVDANQQATEKTEQRQAARARIRMERGANEQPADIGSGKRHVQQLEAVSKQIVHENAKHRERLAKLNRIRELAQESGDAKTVERVDKLIEKQKERYDVKSERMQTRRKKILEFAKRSADANVPGEKSTVGAAVEKLEKEDKSEQEIAEQ
jgi:hypothetical protein